MADPRAQWELDAETARLRAQADSEKRAADRHRREREKADEAERRRLQRMVEEEQREAARKQAAIDAETERLRRLYGAPSSTQLPKRPRQRQEGPYMQSIPQQTQMSLAPPQQPHGRSSSSGGRLGSNGLYVNPSASASAVVMSGGNPGASAPRPTKKKSSFFGLRSSSDDGEQKKRLAKKSSAMW
jgi:hypothetical protein